MDIEIRWIERDKKLVSTNIYLNLNYILRKIFILE